MSFLIAMTTALVFAPIMAVVGRRLGIVDRPGELKIHDRPVPVTGGVAVVVAALAGVVLTGHGSPWIAGAACLALVGGLVDDARSLAPWVRLVVQAGAGVLLVLGGLRLEPLGAFSGIALVVVVVALCNAVNMIDGQDGLAAGGGAIAAFGLAAALATSGLTGALPLSIAGALVGFLAWNRPPARIFLGDGGAYGVGVLLAASASQVTSVGWSGLLAASACLGVFAYELISSVVRRLANATPATRGDRGHLYDRLGRRLRSRGAATLVIWALATVAALIGLAALNVHPIAAVALIVLATASATFFDTRLSAASIAKEKR